MSGIRAGARIVVALVVAIGATAILGMASTAAATVPICPPPTSTLASASTPLLLPEPSQPALPAPPAPAPEAAIVCVGERAIAGSAVAHWTAVARRTGGRHTTGATLADDAISFLISSDWVLGEAEALGVKVTEAEARRSFDRIRAQQFHKRREFQKFLRTTGQTVADLLFRVRLNLTSERIQRHVVSGQTTAKAQERALARFVVEFKRRWMPRTFCAAAYAVSDCGAVF